MLIEAYIKRVCLPVWTSLSADLTLVGPVGVLGGQAAAACALKSSHLSAQEGL